MNNMSSSPFLGAKFANGKHNSEFTIQTRGNEFAPISGTFFIAFENADQEPNTYL